MNDKIHYVGVLTMGQIAEAPTEEILKAAKIVKWAHSSPQPHFFVKTGRTKVEVKSPDKHTVHFRF